MRGNKLRVFAAGVSVGILVIYFGIYLPNIPNTSKPVWLARDPGDDAAFSTASATASASPDLVVAPSPALASDSIPDTAPAPPSTPDVASAEQTIVQTNQALTQDASTVSQGTQTIAQAYSDYASQHGVDFSQSFNQIVTVLGNQTGGATGSAAIWSPYHTFLMIVFFSVSPSARPVIGAVAISYNAPTKTFTVVPAGPTGIKASSIPTINGPTYYVKTTVATGKALIGQTAQNDFYGASKTFVNGLGSNTLKWSQK